MRKMHTVCSSIRKFLLYSYIFVFLSHMLLVKDGHRLPVQTGISSDTIWSHFPLLYSYHQLSTSETSASKL